MDDPMDIDSAPLFDPMPTPDEEFCIYRAPGVEPQYLERYGITLFNPDPNARHDDGKFFIWSVFDLEDLGFKVFLDGHYNYKIEAGAEQGVKRFETSEYEPGVIHGPRTRENLWFLSCRLNQLPSEHVFYPQRPPGLSNIPPKEMLKTGDFVDIQDAQIREQEAGKAKQLEQNAPNLPATQPFFSSDDGVHAYTELEKKHNEVTEALKYWANAPYRQSFNQLLPTLVGPDAIKRLTMAAHGAASIIQKRDSAQYFRDLVTVPFWQRKKNNASSKITRAHFGLPVEPITDININNAGHDTNDIPMAVERDITQIQKQLSYGTPLDFLDEYTESQMGQPGMIRARPKPEDLQYKRLPTDLSDLLGEFEAERMQKHRPRQTCGVGRDDGQIIPDLDFDDSFNFLEKYCMDDTIYPDGLRGGYLPPDSPCDSDSFRALADLDNANKDMQPDARNTEVNKNDADQHREPVVDLLRRVASRIEKRRSDPRGQRRSRGKGSDAPTDRVLAEPLLDTSDTAEEPPFGTRHELMNECEVYVDAEDRSDAAIQKLCQLNGNPACLDEFSSPASTTGTAKINVDKLRPHLKALIESGQLNDAAELLGLQPARVGDKEKEDLKERDACEPMLPIKLRSAKAIRKLLELQEKSDLLAPFANNEKLDVDKLRPLLPGWVRSRKIVDVDGVFYRKWPHKRRVLVDKPVKKSLEERLAPKRARGYDEFRVEKEFQVSLPFEWRHPAVKVKLYGLALNAHPELVEEYRDSKRKLCELRLFEDQFDIPTEEDADELIKAGGDPEKSAKEAEEWEEYIRYRKEVEEQEEPIRGGALRRGAGPDGHEDDEPEEEDRDEEQVVSKSGEVDGYSYEWLKEFYSIDYPAIASRPEKAVLRLQALAMDARPDPLEEYREHDGTLNQEKMRAEMVKVTDILCARDVPQLVLAKAKIPARRQLAEWLAVRRNGPNDLVGVESEPHKLYGYPYRFLEDMYGIGKAPEERSNAAIRNHFEIGNFMEEDETMKEEYTIGGDLNMDEIRGMYGAWIRNRELLDIAVLVRDGQDGANPRIELHYKSWFENQNKLPHLPLAQPGQAKPASDLTPLKTSSDIPSPATSDISPNQVVYNMDNQKWGDLETLYEIRKSIDECTPEAVLRRLGLAWNADESILVKYWDNDQNKLNFEALREDWGSVKEKLSTKVPGELFKMGATVKGSEAQTAELGKFLRWMEDNPLSPPNENQQSNGGQPENSKQWHKPSSNNAPKTPGAKTPFEAEINGVRFSPAQWAVLRSPLKKSNDLQSEKKAQSQVPRHKKTRPVLPQGLGSRKPHFAIPDEGEEDKEEDEEMALARIKLNGPKNDTYEGLAARLQRYGEEPELKERQKMARRDFAQNRSVHSSEKEMPTVPEFGRGVEEAMTYNGGLPTVYLNNYSLKRIQELEDEKRTLQSVVLERAEYCGMCDTHITFESAHQKDNHYRGHRSNATSCGFCAVSFKGMQDFEIKRHLKKHANEKYGAQDQLVPYRNIDKKTDFPDGDVFKFCDACGIDLNTIPTPRAVFQHSIDCRKEGNSASRQHDKLDGDFYCHKCGENLTFQGKSDREKHVSECRWRQALGPDGRDSRLWTFASENVPGGASSSELDISRTYFQLLTLVDVTEHRKPTEEDSGEEEEPYNPRCRFHGCRADLGDFARREKLMEHLGAHVGKRSRRRDICPYTECDQDFEDYRKALKKQAKKDGTVYSDRNLGDQIVEHMKKEHNAYYDAANRPCITCLAREVQNGELGDDVRLAGNVAESSKLQEERKRLEAERKKLDEDREKLEAERRQFEDAKEKEQAERDARKDETASDPAKRTQKKTTTKEKSNSDGKGKGKAPADGDGEEAETDADKTDNDEIPEKDGSEFDPGSDSEDSDEPDNDDGSGGYIYGAKDPKDADAELDSRPGVYESLPGPWQESIKKLAQITEAEAPAVIGMQKKAKHPWTFGCAGCGQAVNKSSLPKHRTVNSKGEAGCGMDDDLELVVTTQRHLRWYREEMQRQGRPMNPYESSPPIPSAPAKPFLWHVWRDLVSNVQAEGAVELRKELLDLSAELQDQKKIMELPLLDGKKMKWNKSPYQKSGGKAGKTAETSKTATTSANKPAKATTSADAAAAAAAAKKTDKTNKNKKRRHTDGDKDDEDNVDETQKTGKGTRRSTRLAKKQRNTL